MIFKGVKVKSIISILILMTSMAAKAQFETKDLGYVGDGKDFATESMADVEPGKVTYRYRLVEFKDWMGQQKKTLNLFETFEPRADKPLIMYIARATAILDKRSDQINLKPFVTPSIIQTLDPGNVFSAVLPVEKIVTKTETSSSYRNPPEPVQWCEGNNNILCMSSKFALPTDPDYAAMFAAKARKAGSPYLDLSAQSELKIATGREITNAADLSALTGIKDKNGRLVPVSSVATQNSFWFTHMLGFAKTLIVFQTNPLNPNQTIATAYMAFGIEHSAWDNVIDLYVKKIAVKDIFLGRSAVTQPQGIMSGLPCYTQNLTTVFANLFSR